MKYFAIRDAIEDSLYNKFIDFYNQYSEEECRIIIDSGGGEMSAATLFINIINSMPNVSIVIINAYSAAFIIAYYCKCNKLMYKNSRGMWHYSHMKMDINVDGKPSYFEHECTLRNFKMQHKEQKTFAKKVMNKDEYISYLKGNDVFFDMHRMKQIFPDAKII